MTLIIFKPLRFLAFVFSLFFIDYMLYSVGVPSWFVIPFSLIYGIVWPFPFIELEKIDNKDEKSND